MAAKPPADLCPEHRRIWAAWRNNRYNPDCPREPGGGQLLDSRTTHTERLTAWKRFNTTQMTAVEQTCRSGRSPQCTTTQLAA